MKAIPVFVPATIVLILALGGCGNRGAGRGGGVDGAGDVQTSGGDGSGDDVDGATQGDGGSGGVVAMCGTRADPGQFLNCNSVMPTGPCVTLTVTIGDPPAPTGGAWQIGTYDLVSSVYYQLAAGLGPGVDPRRATLVATGSGSTFTMQMGHLSGTMLMRANAVATISGTEVTTVTTCPPPGDPAGPPHGYTATATSLAIHDGQRVDTYVKR